MRAILPGTFRPDRIKSIADRFGVDGNMALENILYGDSLDTLIWPCLYKFPIARAFNSEHQVGGLVPVTNRSSDNPRDGIDKRMLLPVCRGQGFPTFGK